MKNLMKILTLALTSLLVLGSLSGCATSTSEVTEESSTAGKWDRETDFLVVGYGLAGEAAALEASDIAPEGTEILVLEKMNEAMAGGNSIASGQTFVVPARDDVETFKTYMEACAEPNPIPDEYMDWLVNEFANQAEWVSATVNEGGYEVGYVGGGPGRWGSLVVEFADLPGADFKGASLHVREKGASFTNGGVWHGFDAATKLREDITVEYETQVVGLVQDPATKEILGVEAVDGKGNEIRIKANDGVLMACGGFENNLEMQKNLHGMDRTYTSGTPGNTGDGIQMLMEVGAKMWHMKNQTQSGGLWLGLKVPEFESSFIVNMAFKTGEYMQIDSNGDRFYNESKSYHRQHMKAIKYGKYLDLPLDVAMPIHFICDDTFVKNNVLITPWLSWPVTTEGYVWSADNQTEIDKGWITKADTIEELATLIDRDPVALQEEIDEYNAAVEAGVDAKYGRDIETMGKIMTAPYYAFEIVPALVATTGGAVRNTNSQVLDWDGNVIPNLYEAGELGSYVSNLYQNGVFLSEAIASGRAAAQHIYDAESTVTDPEFKILDEVVKNTESIFKNFDDTSYEVKCESLHGPFVVNAKISEGKLALLDIIEGDDNVFAEPEQIRELFDNIIANQSIEVDLISGATTDSQSILDGLRSTFAK